MCSEKINNGKNEKCADIGCCCQEMEGMLKKCFPEGGLGKCSPFTMMMKNMKEDDCCKFWKKCCSETDNLL